MSYKRPRNAGLTLLLDVYRKYKVGDLTIEECFETLLLAELEPWERIVLHHVQTCPDCTGPEVAEKEAMRLNHADTVLKRLFDLGLIDRRPLSEVTGRVYTYQAKDWTQWHKS